MRWGLRIKRQTKGGSFEFHAGSDPARNEASKSLIQRHFWKIVIGASVVTTSALGGTIVIKPGLIGSVLQTVIHHVVGDQKPAIPSKGSITIRPTPPEIRSYDLSPMLAPDLLGPNIPFDFGPRTKSAPDSPQPPTAVPLPRPRPINLGNRYLIADSITKTADLRVPAYGQPLASCVGFSRDLHLESLDKCNDEKVEEKTSNSFSRSLLWLKQVLHRVTKSAP